MNSNEYLKELLNKRKDLELKMDYLRNQIEDESDKKTRDAYFDLFKKISIELKLIKDKINFIYNLKGEMDRENILHKKR